MKFLHISDAHIHSERPTERIDENFLDTQRNKLITLFDYARENNIKYIFSAGDQTETPTNFVSLTLWSEILELYPDIFLCYVYGQHDMVQRNILKSSIMGFLERYPNVIRLTGKPLIIENWNIYGCDFGSSPKIPFPSKNKTMLISHVSVTNDMKFREIINSKGNSSVGTALNYLKKNKRFDVIHVGDIHRKFICEEDGRYIINPGPVVRRVRDEYSLENKSYFIEFDTDEMTFKEIAFFEDSPDRNFNITSLELKKEQNKLIKDFIENLSHAKAKSKNVLSAIWQTAEEIDFEVFTVLKKVYNSINEKG